MLNGVAKGFGVFDHWFSEVPSQTFMNRSFWTAGTSSGFVTNAPAMKWTNTAETLFDRLEAHGRTWKVYVLDRPPLVHGLDPHPPLKDRLATHIVPFSEFERDANNETLPDFSLIEPLLVAGHGDYHPAEGRSFSVTTSTSPSTRRPRSSPARTSWRVSTGRSRSADSSEGSNAYNTVLHRLGRARGNLRPRSSGPVPPPTQHPGRGVRLHLRPLRLPRARDHRLPVDRRGHGDQRRVPPHLAARHAAQELDLGDPFSDRDAAARTFDHLLSRETPRDPASWPDVHPRQCRNGSSPRCSSVRRSARRQGHRPGLVEHAKQAGLPIPADIADAKEPLTGQQLVEVVFDVAAHYFRASPRLRNPLMPGARRRAGARAALRRRALPVALALVDASPGQLLAESRPASETRVSSRRSRAS